MSVYRNWADTPFLLPVPSLPLPLHRLQKYLFYYDEEFLAEAQAVKQVTDRYGVLLIINDNVDVAIAVDAAGVHVGQEDMGAGEVRRRLGPQKILGVSAQTVAHALAAQAAGADYAKICAASFTSGCPKIAEITATPTMPVR